MSPRPDTPGHRAVSISSGKYRSRVLQKRDALITQHLYLVAPIARRIGKTLPACFDVDDLIAVGHLGLITAATRYRPIEHPGIPFSVYAYPKVRGAILDSVRRRHYANATHAPLEDSPEPIMEPPPMEEIIDRQDHTRRIGMMRDLLTDEQCRVMDAYYSPDMPSFETVGEMLRIPAWRATLAHREALEIFRENLQAA